MAIYMIDYENVKTGGLNGISRLTAGDSVIIFYSENANRLTFDLHRRLMACPAHIEYREVSVGGHNALDFQLVTYLGYLIASDRDGQYLIISNDRGFEYVVNFWRREGLSIGLLPYLKDPTYALQRVTRTDEAEGSAEEAQPLPPAEPIADIPAEEPNGKPVTVTFCTVEEEPAPQATLPADVLPVEAKTPAEEPAPAPAKKKNARRKAPQKKPAKQEQPKAERKLPTEEELRELLGDLVEDDPECRFVLHSLERYKTKLGLNNALVKNFGNQRAGEIYQKIKNFAK